VIVCEKCGTPYGIGDYPFCRGGHGRYNVSVVDDQIEGGPRFFETMGDKDVWIESKSQWRKEVDARQLVNVVRHDSAYYAKRRQMHDEELRDTGTNREF
jgi:hypothetical protein